MVTILLNIVRPDFAFFGQKDAQQAAVHQTDGERSGFRYEIVVLPIVREDSGLAMSSRNLISERRRAAGGDGFASRTGAGEASITMMVSGARALAEIVRSTIETEPLARIDYVSVNDA